MTTGDKKRKHAQYEEDDQTANDIGLGATVAHLKAPRPSADSSSTSKPEHEDAPQGTDEDGWTKVPRSQRHRLNKRQKKEHDFHRERGFEQLGRRDSHTQTALDKGKKNNYPSVTYAALHTIQNSLKVSDLQSLLLYCLADGTAPQWLSVRHHGQIRKAVVLLVPGLESGMFNGSIDLPETVPNGSTAGEASEPGSISNGCPPEEAESHVASTKANHVTRKPSVAGISPDEFLPSPLRVDRLPAPLRPLAGIFEHLWPVKAPGDEKYHKVHSPIHAMLTSPIPKSREERQAEKNIKGAKPIRGDKHWDNKPTPITAFLTSKDDLVENEYTLHPVAFTTVEEKVKELERRKGANDAAGDLWVDTTVVRLEDAEVADVRSGSLTAGRNVLAMDCEMCLVEGGESALTRISIVGWDGTIVMDALVKPDKPIIDFLTP